MGFPKRKKQAASFRDVAQSAPACPTCGASGDEPCRTASGKVTEDHAKRVR